MKLKLTHFVAKERRDHTVRHYWQPTSALKVRGWVNERLSDDRDTAIIEALALSERLANWRAHKGARPNGEDIDDTPSTCFALLLKDFLGSIEFHRLSPASRKYYSLAVKVLTEKFGGREVGGITAADVNNLKQSYSHQTGTAAQLVRTGQAAMSWAIRTGYTGAPTTLDLNPWAKQKLSCNAKEARIWTAEQIDAIVHHADTVPAPGGKLLPSIGTAILMMEWLGHYPADIISMMWSNYKNNQFTFKRQKNGHKTGITIKCDSSPRLSERLVMEKYRQPLSTHMLVNEATGRPWTVGNLRTHFRRIVNELAVKDESFKGLIMGHLRHTAITNMFDAGINPIAIASITGHSLNQVYAILDLYNKRTEKQSRTATTTRLATDKRHQG